MQWDELLGHDLQQKWFRTALKNGRLASSFLFVGSAGIGKRTFARLLAKSLLCRQTPPDELAACGQCEDCAQVDASTHPDLLQVAKPAEKAALPLELLIGPPQNRMREGLIYDISLRPYAGRRKIAILDDADTLNAESANCLLKTLEEPPSDSLLILIGTSLQRQLPTIRSRCQSILFGNLTDDQVLQLFKQQFEGESEEVEEWTPAHWQQLASQSGGSLSRARMLADKELLGFRQSLTQMLSAEQMPINHLIKDFTAIVDAVGKKENRAKRDRTRILIQEAAEHYRQGSLNCSDSVQARTAIRCWDRCLRAIEQVERNANQASLIEAWVTDLAVLSGR